MKLPALNPTFKKRFGFENANTACILVPLLCFGVNTSYVCSYARKTNNRPTAPAKTDLRPLRTVLACGCAMEPCEETWQGARHGDHKTLSLERDFNFDGLVGQTAEGLNDR